MKKKNCFSVVNNYAAMNAKTTSTNGRKGLKSV